jgi:hypothetical protein
MRPRRSSLPCTPVTRWAEAVIATLLSAPVFTLQKEWASALSKNAAGTVQVPAAFLDIFLCNDYGLVVVCVVVDSVRELVPLLVVVLLPVLYELEPVSGVVTVVVVPGVTIVVSERVVEEVLDAGCAGTVVVVSVVSVHPA